jgi:small subunit ribosomal protein S6
MAQYEFMLIIDPKLSEADRNSSLDNLKKIFKDNNVIIEKEDVWGDKKLAYKINGSERGFYVLFDIEMEGKLIKEISKTINLDRNIWRYMFTAKES